MAQVIYTNKWGKLTSQYYASEAIALRAATELCLHNNVECTQGALVKVLNDQGNVVWSSSTKC